MPNIAEIEATIAVAESETGVVGRSRFRVCMKPVKRRHRMWTTREIQFIRENHGRRSEEDMARALGRTKTSVHIQITREMHLCPPSKSPQILTAEHIAVGLGVDGKSVHLLIDRGILPGRRLPTSRPIRVVNRTVFLRWISDPMNWVYIKPHRIGELRPRGRRQVSDVYDYSFWESARALVIGIMRKWNDRWLTPREAAQYLHVQASGTRYINKAIRKGTIKATRWGNWRILRSALPARGTTINFNGDIVKRHK